MHKRKSSRAADLSARIGQVRLSIFGPRGRAKFARALGVSPSTYSRYERGTIPTAAMLLKISSVSGADLRWLLTGRRPVPQTQRISTPRHAGILARMSALLPRAPEAIAALSVLLDLLEALPEKPVQHEVQPAGSPRRTVRLRGTAQIPVLGRTAAGVPQFWKHPQKTVDLLRSAVARVTGDGESHTASLDKPERPTTTGQPETVHLVQLTNPVRVGELYIAEFLDCPGLGGKWPDAFALRIDGDSMHPSLSHGNYVILSPSQPARAGRAAVIQLRNQIGVTCKLFRADKRYVHLIPINSQFQPTRHPHKELAWALAVLHRVRIVT